MTIKERGEVQWLEHCGGYADHNYNDCVSMLWVFSEKREYWRCEKIDWVKLGLI